MTQQQRREYDGKTTEALSKLLLKDFENTNEPPLTVEEILLILEILLQRNHPRSDTQASWHRFQKLYLDDK